jgi:ADP-heptose:LPS heptosyltransferase
MGIKEVGRRWSLEKYAALARRLVQTFACQIVVLWGPDERSLVPLFEEAVKELSPSH